MEQPANDELATRVLVLAPTNRDAEVTCDLLPRAGLACMACRSVFALKDEIVRGAGAVLLTEDMIAENGVAELLGVLRSQPAWSEIPFVVLIRGGTQSPASTAVLRALGNVTLLERPAPMRSVISALQVAVRGRRRQYQIRDQIEAIRHGEEAREQLLESERAARAEAERANRMKDEFLATLSHELRTPLNAILGWSQLLQRGQPDAEDLKQGLDTIDRNARAQTQLIEDLLDMSRIVSGKLRLDLQPINPSDVVEAAIESVRPSADAKGVRIEKRIDSNTPHVRGDASRMQQVIWNLLTNAIKFTPAGGKIQVNVTRQVSRVEISVSDTGYGIQAEFLPYVFDRFRQADASTTRKHGGLGLGLAIVKHLVELQHGTVEAMSPGPNQGSTFTVSLPAISAMSAARSLKSGIGFELASLEGLSVLTVDDEPDARHLIKRILEECGASVRTAASGADALKMLNDYHPDVVISDISMPELDGYEFIRRVRLLGAHGNAPAIALTAFARSEDRTQALRAGFLAHLSKPVEPAELIATVASVAGRT